MDSLTTLFHEQVFEPYRELLNVKYRFHPTFKRASEIWKQRLTAEELINGPYLEKAHTYKQGAEVDSLGLTKEVSETVRLRLGGHRPWQHQSDAIRMISSGKNTIIATGTSSGKTLCYQTPILDDLIRNPGAGLRAIIIYPLNALVNDQLEEWERLLKRHKTVTFARFTGQTPATKEEYEKRVEAQIRQSLFDKKFSQQEMQKETIRLVREKFDLESREIPNRLNHREAIRSSPPNILVTNFSMLEYLLERPIDAPIFENARLKFLVLDEVHAYRGIQATEIAFLIRRLKDRLKADSLVCIGTSATLGKKDDPKSEEKVRAFASQLFDTPFSSPNPVYGEAEEPLLRTPSIAPSIDDYLTLADALDKNPAYDFRPLLKLNQESPSLATALEHDVNFHRLRKDVLTRPKLLGEAAKELWPNNGMAKAGLQALLKVASIAKTTGTNEDLCPTRLHYFVRTQDGFYVCLNPSCPARTQDGPSFYVSRKNGNPPVLDICPDCNEKKLRSKLVEVVGCRKCGYLYGALQDLGPKRALNKEADPEQPKATHDSFSTDLGVASDSFWTYFSVEGDLPFPPQVESSEEDEDDLISHPDEVSWCVICGKKRDNGAADICTCATPVLRTISIFHRQCPIKTLRPLNKRLLSSCPNCNARNTSGIEPVKRFQESDDEVGMAMAVPLAHFNFGKPADGERNYRKLLCFTDHRQRAAAFPSLLEEETFVYDLGRKILEIVRAKGDKSCGFVDLGISLFKSTQKGEKSFDSDFFLPVSRFSDEAPHDKELVFQNLWISEVFAYFGIPDSAREALDDFGLVAVEFRTRAEEENGFFAITKPHGLSAAESSNMLQILLGFVRQHKAFTLPSGVRPSDPAFGNVTADVSFVLQVDGAANSRGWIPKRTGQQNSITDFVRRVFKHEHDDQTRMLSKSIWDFLIRSSILIDKNKTYRLDHERLRVVIPNQTYKCSKCGRITTFDCKGTCPKRDCGGIIQKTKEGPDSSNIVTRWLTGEDHRRFSSLRSEEHTAQINKDVAKKIEDDFRAQGVNLLSSTTTFEMGINIGDLQKVLLRNAPPSSASYIQRIGRAGRGSDKNAVSVTLCRRTKYDADAWDNPVRLMSGIVRTPTVFVKNRVIAQRHFNALLFAKFLRDELLVGQKLISLRQQIPIAPFIPSSAREGIPTDWFPPDCGSVVLDLNEWLKAQNIEKIFSSAPAATLAVAIGDIKTGVSCMTSKYDECISQITSEMQALMEERKKLQAEGKDEAAVDIKDSVRNLLRDDVINVLAKRGLLPRYAFPLDVVTLETGLTRWLRDKDVDLSRDRSLAISEFAPGAQVIAKKKVFTSAGLYVVGKNDEPERRWYSHCPNCRQIRVAASQSSLIGECAVCNRGISSQYIRGYVEPLAFSVRTERRSDSAGKKYRPSTLIRQRQSLTHFIDNLDNSQFNPKGAFDLALKESGSLFRYNLGPSEKGFMICRKCGCSEPMQGLKPAMSHKRLRVFSGAETCSSETWKDISYGHGFESFCLIARPRGFMQSVESVAYALQKGLCRSLEIEASDIGVSWRFFHDDAKAKVPEIILYDLAPGGAGFVRDGFQEWENVIKEAVALCRDCICEGACYDCLKDYGNQAHHERLNRRQVLGFFGA